MIPSLHIVAWGRAVPWAEPRQVEQDLIISRAVVTLFDDPFLRRELRFRGGTALNKLHFPAPLRYSEDIDLVRTTTGPIGPLFPAAEAAKLTDEAIGAAFTLVFGELVARLPGAPWSRTPEMADRFGIEVV